MAARAYEKAEMDVRMRQSGILLHITSLPSPYGIGTFGKAAYAFVDFLRNAKQTYWQILPLGMTSYGDSPYQSFSTFAGNPYFIDLDLLCKEGLLKTADYRRLQWGNCLTHIDYEIIYKQRYAVLQIAYQRFIKQLEKQPEYLAFCKAEQDWLDDYAVFMAVKAMHGGISWHDWEAPYQTRDQKTMTAFRKTHKEKIDFWKFLQFQFFRQWFALKKYANDNGIFIIGDLPIYVADDSVDVWANPELFDLSEDLQPRVVAGCPPDGFTKNGQLWGNPVYNWHEMKKNNYSWWIERIRKNAALCDMIRLDHFRGFENYYVIPRGAETAEHGKWKKGPGFAMFDAVRSALGDVNIIAENLGMLTPRVRKLHRQTGYPGMRVLQFGFGADDVQNENLPHNISENNVAYAGTHDNPTILQWLHQMNPRDKAFCLDYMNVEDERDFVWKFIKLVHSTRAHISMITMQDYLELGASARMNCPATTQNNWQWRAARKDFNKRLCKRIAHITALYGRCGAQAGNQTIR